MPEMKSLTLNGTTYDNFVDQAARSAALGSAIINSASGENITLTDASKFNLLELHIYGKTTQNGTPTPDAPVELECVGDSGSITVNVTGEKESQSMVVSTPNGLPGIPVTSGGNYTDENGQQWISDEIDFAKGVYIQRVGAITFDGTEIWENYLLNTMNQFFTRVSVRHISSEIGAMCAYYKPITIDERTRNYGTIYTYEGGIAFNTLECTTVEEWISLLGQRPTTVVYVIKNHIETPLSEEELAAYADLHTYRDNTMISNDASAHMDIEYVMDGKKYIDSLIASGGMSTARLTTITIRASEWSGSDSLYSQVVTVEGVKPNSKVDLLPSVEQLAIFHNKDVSFVTENENGVITVYAIGDKPLLDYTMQAQITEVVV